MTSPRIVSGLCRFAAQAAYSIQLHQAGRIKPGFMNVWTEWYGGCLVCAIQMAATGGATLPLSVADTYPMFLLAALGVGLAGVPSSWVSPACRVGTRSKLAKGCCTVCPNTCNRGRIDRSRTGRHRQPPGSLIFRHPSQADRSAQIQHTTAHVLSKSLSSDTAGDQAQGSGPPARSHTVVNRKAFVRLSC